MTRRKGEITRVDFKRKWPHHVVLSAGKLLGVESVVHRCANSRSARRTFLTRHGDREYVVFCFTKPDDAEAFAERFGGERLPSTRR